MVIETLIRFPTRCKFNFTVEVLGIVVDINVEAIEEAVNFVVESTAFKVVVVCTEDTDETAANVTKCSTSFYQAYRLQTLSKNIY